MNISPLKKKKPNGALYQRFKDVEAALGILWSLPDADLIDRLALGPSDKNYVQSQCLMHLARHSRGNRRVFESVFRTLAARLRQIRPATLIPHLKHDTLETAFDEFNMRFAEDGVIDQDRLDFFEVDFKSAYKSIILDAQRHHIAQSEKHVAPQIKESTDDEDHALEDEANIHDSTLIERIDLSRQWGKALERMTLRQRLITKMRRQGLLIESKNPNEPTIAKLVNVDPKTVRSDLAKALKIFKQISEEGESS